MKGKNIILIGVGASAIAASLSTRWQSTNLNDSQKLQAVL